MLNLFWFVFIFWGILGIVWDDRFWFKIKLLELGYGEIFMEGVGWGNNFVYFLEVDWKLWGGNWSF